jgi:signal transduction histidine kinase
VLRLRGKSVTVNVCVVDDQEPIRSAVSELLSESEGICVVGQAENGAAGVEAVLASSCDVVLMDLRMPIMDGVEATRRLNELGSTASVLIHSAYGDDSLVLDAFQAGARGYILKGSAASDLVDAVMTVAAGHSHISDEVTRPLVERLVKALGRERKTRLEAEEAARRLAELNARQREFSLQASHELRTPLTGLLGNLEMVVTDEMPAEDRASMISSALSAARRLQRLAENLEVTASSELLDLRVEHVAVAEFVDAVVARLDAAEDAVRCDIQKDLVVVADPKRLEQALGNVVRNALYASPKGTPVRVRARHDGDRVVIDVSDSGSGFEVTQLAQVFEPYVHRPEASSGLGVGLSVVAKLVSRMSGEVVAMNNDVGGATVRITLPGGKQ